MRGLSIVIGCLIALVSAADADEPLCLIQVRLELSSTVLMLADPVYARVTLKNLGDTDAEVLAPTRDIGTLRFDVQGQGDLAIRLWPDGEGIGLYDKIRLKPGEEFEVWDRLRLPRVRQLETPFWTTEGADYVIATVKVTKELQLISNPVYIRLDARPQNEIALLKEVYNTEDSAQDKKAAIQDDASEVSLNGFGLGHFPINASKPATLAKLDKALSPSGLRNVVRVTRLVQQYENASDTDERRRTLAALTKLVDGLPKLERYWISKKIYELGMYTHKLYMVDLSEIFIERLPDNMGSKTGLRQQRIGQMRHRRGFIEVTTVKE